MQPRGVTRRQLIVRKSGFYLCTGANELRETRRFIADIAFCIRDSLPV